MKGSGHCPRPQGRRLAAAIQPILCRRRRISERSSPRRHRACPPPACPCRTTSSPDLRRISLRPPPQKLLSSPLRRSGCRTPTAANEPRVVPDPPAVQQVRFRPDPCRDIISRRCPRTFVVAGAVPKARSLPVPPTSRRSPTQNTTQNPIRTFVAGAPFRTSLPPSPSVASDRDPPFEEIGRGIALKEQVAASAGPFLAAVCRRVIETGGRDQKIDFLFHSVQPKFWVAPVTVVVGVPPVCVGSRPTTAHAIRS